MTKKSHESGMVSWKVFNDLYENQFDAFRKLKFFVKAGKTGKNASLALEMIEEFLENREADLEQIRRDGLDERVDVDAEQAMDRALVISAGTDGENGSLIPAAQAPARTSYWSRLKSRIWGYL